jgi:hypothetical protein
MLQVYAWLPLQLLLVDKIVCTRKAKYYALLTGVILLSLFAGFPQATLYGSCLLVAYWLYRRYQSMADERVFRSALETSRQIGAECLRISVLFSAVLLLGAIQLVPALEQWYLSPRVKWDFQDVANGSMPPRNVIQFLIPNFFGFSNESRTGTSFWGFEKNVTPAVPPEVTGHWEYWEFGAYAGQLSILALLAIVFYRREFRSVPARFFVVAGILAMWFMLGRYGGLFRVLSAIVPGLSLFSSPARMASVVDLCAAVSVAFFVDAQTRGGSLRLGKPLAMVFAAYAIGWSVFLAWGMQIFPELQQSGRAVFANQQILISLLLFLGTGVCLLGIRPQVAGPLRGVSSVALALFSFADFYHAYGFFHQTPNNPSKYYSRNSWIIDKHMGFAREAGPVRLAQFVDGRWAEFAIAESGPLIFPGLETPRGYVDLVTSHMALFKQLTNQTALLDLQNVGTVLLLNTQNGRFDYLNRGGSPRLRFFSRIKTYGSDEDILHDLDSGELDYSDTAAVDAHELGGSLADFKPVGRPPRSILQLQTDSPESYRINYSVDSPGILFVSESYYPGWEVVDKQGKPFQIVRTFVAFKGIVIPQAGQGELTVRFRPRSFLLGAGISGTTAILLGILCFVLIRRARDAEVGPGPVWELHPSVDQQTPVGVR